MKRLGGLMLFCIGFGMALMIILPTNIWIIICSIVLMIIGYNLFCCGK